METNGNEVNLDVILSKQDWVTVVQWVSVRWPVNWSDDDIVSLYEDYKVFPKDVVWKSLFNYLNGGHEFFNSPKFFQLCHETWLRLEKEGESNKALPMGKVADANANGLLQFLLINGYDSVRHAAYDFSQQRVKSGRAVGNESEIIDPDEPWESAQKWFEFPWNRTVEQLKAKSESQEGSNGK